MDNQLSDNINSKILSRSLKQMHFDKKGIRTMPDKDEFPIEYLMNSQGYRCEEITNQKILTLGCSQTEGHGLPLELTWPYLLSQKMNMGYVNLAKGGDGAQGQVTKAFQFFKEFYKPDYIFAVFPLSRLEIPTIMNYFYSQNKRRNRKDYIPEPHTIVSGLFNNKNLEKFSKMPYFAEDILPEDFILFYNILFIKMLDEYCRSNNIKFIWTHQADVTSLWKHYDKIKSRITFEKEMDGYFYNDAIQILEDKCHLEFSNNIFFNKASDTNKFPPGHWSFHQHIHLAEKIYEMIK